MLSTLQYKIITTTQSVSPASGQCNAHAYESMLSLILLFVSLSVYYDTVRSTAFGCLIHVYILLHYEVHA